VKRRLDISEFTRLQRELGKKLILTDYFGKIETVAGADVSFSKDGRWGCAGVMVFSLRGLEEIERGYSAGKIEFPYIPGFLSFRESPLLLEVFKRLKVRPDVVIFDGQGIAHPRRFGLASHMGILLGIPSIGCAKSHLIGNWNEPCNRKGCFEYLYDPKDGSIIGAVVRTKDLVKPLFVSQGHMVSLETAINLVLKCTDGFRIPKPTRMAHTYTRMLIKELLR